MKLVESIIQPITRSIVGGLRSLVPLSIQALGFRSPWIADDGTTPVDQASGKGTSRPRQDGRCTVLDGTQFIESGSAALGQVDQTIGCWLKGSGSVTSSQYPLSQRSNASTGGLSILLNNSGNLTVYIGGSSVAGSSTAIDVDGKWMFLVVGYNSQTDEVSIWFDGVLQKQVDASGSSGNWATTPNFLVGSRQGTGPGDAKLGFEGQLSHAFRYPRVLTATEITRLCQQGFDAFQSIQDYPTDADLYFPLEDGSAGDSDTYRNIGSLGLAGDGTLYNGDVGVNYVGSDVPISFADLHGYGPTGEPLKLADRSVDVLDNEAEHTGVAPVNGDLHSSPCGTFDGADDYLSVPHLTGSETVTSSGGTSTPTVSAGRIDFTAGTCWDLLLSDGSRFAFSESSGGTVYNVAESGSDATIQNASLAAVWAATQNDFHYDVLYGWSDSGGVHVPALLDGSTDALGDPIEFPAGNGLNTPNTLLDFAPNQNANWVDRVWMGYFQPQETGYIHATLIEAVTEYPFTTEYEVAGSVSPLLAGDVSLCDDTLSGVYFATYTDEGNRVRVSRRNTTSRLTDIDVAANSGFKKITTKYINETTLQVLVDGEEVFYADDLTSVPEASLNTMSIGSFRVVTPGTISDHDIRNVKLYRDGVLTNHWPLNGHALDVVGNANGFMVGAHSFPTITMETDYQKGDGRTAPNHVTMTDKLDSKFYTERT